jgi:hypothetical protein
VDRVLNGPLAEGMLALESEGQPVTDESDVVSLLTETLESHLDWLSRAALIEATQTSDRPYV